MAAYPTELSELSQAQLSRFTAYFKSKQENAMYTFEAEKGNFYSDHLADESAIFNQQDVLNLLETYHQMVMGNVRVELDNNNSLAGVYASLLLAQAEASGLALQVEDISVVDDQSRVDQLDALAAIKAAPPMPKSRAVLEAVGGGTADVATLQALEDSREEVRQMKDRERVMQTEVQSLMKERSTMMSELEMVKQNFKNLMQQRHAEDPSAGFGSAEIEQTRAMLDAKSVECEELRKDMNKRLGDSSQFRDLKAIVKTKSSQIKELKAVLMQHGLMQVEDEGVELEADSD